jgi:hypothetical protein
LASPLLFALSIPSLTKEVVIGSLIYAVLFILPSLIVNIIGYRFPSKLLDGLELVFLMFSWMLNGPILLLTFVSGIGSYYVIYCFLSPALVKMGIGSVVVVDWNLLWPMIKGNVVLIAIIVPSTLAKK